MKNTDELIQISSFYDSSENILITKNRVEDLLSKGFLKKVVIDKEVYFYEYELHQLIQKEKTLSNDYLNKNEFLSAINNSSSYQGFKNSVEDIHKLCSSVHKIRSKKHLGIIYYSKYDIKGFLKRVKTKREVMNEFKLNAFLYNEIINAKNINVIRITKNTEYIPISAFPIIKQQLQTYNSKYRKEIWIRGTTIIKRKILSRLFVKIDTLIKCCQKNSLKHFFDNNKTFYVEYKSLMTYYRKQINLINNYYSLTETIKLFGVNNTSLTTLKNKFVPGLLSLCKKKEISYIHLSKDIAGNTIFFNKTQIDDLLNKHVSNKEIVEKYSINYAALNYLIEYFQIEYLELHTRLKLYNALEIEEMMEKEVTKLYLKKSSHFYTLLQTLNLLSITDVEFNTVRKEECLKYYNFHNTTYYQKKEIDNLIQKQKDTYNLYVPSSLVKNTYGDNALKSFTIKLFPTGIQRYSFPEYSAINLLLSRNEYEIYSKNKSESLLVNSISYSNPVVAFIELLSIKNINFSEACSKTKNHWIDYCKTLILRSNKSKETIPYFVNELVKCTALLSSFAYDKEFFYKTTMEIQFGLLNSSVPNRHQELLLTFITQLKYLLAKENIKVSYKEKLLKKESNSTSKIKYDKEIYDYETFKKLYAYLNNLNHKDIVISKFTQINDQSDYAYSWFYSLFHLNNAWRHRDICNIQMIDISFLNFKNLSDFSKRDLTIEEVNKIVNLIIAREYTVAKTSAESNLYISDDIKKSFATAYVICHLINEKKLITQDRRTINFNNKNNDFSSYQNKLLFESFIPKFNFKNRKMNRTVLTIMHTLLINNGKTSAALNVAKRLRSHMSIESTNMYINIPKNELNILSINLFDRGIFGYIPKILNEIILGKSLNFVEETKSIKKIQSVFKNIYQIEATAGFLNNVLKQKDSINQLLLSLGSEKALNILTSLQMNTLYSKDENFQCLLADTGCIYPDLNCSNCAYSIPNFFAISNLTSSVKDSLINFKDKFENANFEIEKIKFVNLLFMELDLLNEAMKIFGKEVILEFFNDKEGGYIQLINSLNDVVSNKPLSEYATYQLKE